VRALGVTGADVVCLLAGRGGRSMMPVRDVVGIDGAGQRGFLSAGPDRRDGTSGRAVPGGGRSSMETELPGGIPADRHDGRGLVVAGLHTMDG